MKHTVAGSLLSRALLCFVRDHAPTLEDFTVRFGGPGGHAFHVLRKAEAIVVDGGRVRLSPRHLSPDGLRFVWGEAVWWLDRDEIMLMRCGQEVPSDVVQDAEPGATPDRGGE